MKEKEDKMSLDNDIYHHIDVTVQMTRKKKHSQNEEDELANT
jgi:hypothetical protein